VPTQPPIQWALGSLTPGVKRPARQADHLPPSSSEVVKEWSCNSTISICFHGVYGNNITLINYLLKTVFWDVTQCSFVVWYRRYGRTFSLHYQGPSGGTLSNYRRCFPDDMISIPFVVRSRNPMIFQISMTSVNSLAYTKIVVDSAICFHISARHRINGCHCVYLTSVTVQGVRLLPLVSNVT
jgi:hypothetical protein